ncbi:hypothetical protein [Actinotalea ferrariae]|nr:hypothetical protein [Actinotalea ferrariae]
MSVLLGVHLWAQPYSGFMPPRREDQTTPERSTASPGGAHGWRAGLALCSRWIVRVVAGSVVSVALLVVGFALFQPSQDWSAVGGPGRFVSDSLALLLFISPVLAGVGVTLAVAIWIALRVSRGSAKAGATTAGLAAAGLSMAYVLLYSAPRLPDLLGYLALSAGIGSIATYMTFRDISRIRSLTRWLARLRQGRRVDAV